MNALKTSAYALSALAILAFAAPSFAQVNAGTGANANVGVGAGGANAGAGTDSNTNMKSSKGHARAEDRAGTKAHKSQAQAPKAGVSGGANGKADVK